MNILKSGLEFLIQSFSNNSIEAAFYTVLFFLAGWLFINIKNRIEKTEFLKLKNESSVIKNLSKLLFYLNSLNQESFKNISLDEKNRINSIISDIIPHVSVNFTDFLIKWQRYKKKEFVSLIRKKIKDYKNNQGLYFYYDDITILKSLKWGIHSSGLKTYVLSSIFVLLILVFVAIIFQMILETEASGGGLSVFVVGSKYVCNLLILLSFISVLDESWIRKNKLKLRYWIFIYIFIILSAIFINVLQNFIIYTLGIILYLFLNVFLSRSIEKTK